MKMYEFECLTDAAYSAAGQSCVPDCPCQPDQRENECFPYFSDTESDGREAFADTY
jgi:hypothetical protein